MTASGLVYKVYWKIKTQYRRNEGQLGDDKKRFWAELVWAMVREADARFGDDDIRWQDGDVCRYAGLTTHQKKKTALFRLNREDWSEPRRLEHEDDIDNAYHSLHNTAFLEFAEEENGHRDMQMVEVGACWTRRELSAAEFIAILLPAEDEHGLPTRDVFSPYVFNAKPGGLEGGMPRANLFPTTVNPLRPPGRRAHLVLEQERQQNSEAMQASTRLRRQDQKTSSSSNSLVSKRFTYLVCVCRVSQNLSCAYRIRNVLHDKAHALRS